MRSISKNRLAPDNMRTVEMEKGAQTTSVASIRLRSRIIMGRCVTALGGGCARPGSGAHATAAARSRVATTEWSTGSARHGWCIARRRTVGVDTKRSKRKQQFGIGPRRQLSSRWEIVVGLNVPLSSGRSRTRRSSTSGRCDRVWCTVRR